jgi:hypothetical protein
MATPIARRIPEPHSRPLPPIASLALILLLGAARPVAAGGFAPGVSTNFTTSVSPRTIVMGDVNNDGIVDMIANGSGGSGVFVFRGLGGGTFAPAQGFAANAGGIPALGDFNLDGNLDIAIPLTSLQFIQIYNGNGDGTFASGSTFSIPANSEVLVSADFNGDGKADLATAGNSTPSTGTLRVFLNITASPGAIVNMSGTDYAVAAQPRGVAVGKNLFGTNTNDLVTANQSAGSVTLMKNNGAGVFGNRLDVPTQKSCYAVAVGGLWAGEVRPQIVTANKDSAAVSVVVYSTTTSTWLSQKYATAADPRSVSLGDTDGNGNLDIVVSALASNMVSILSPTFDGTSTWFKPHVDIAAGSHPWAASVVNFDGDQKPDLLVCVNGSNRISWIHGVPKAGWALGDTIPAFAAKNQYDDTFQSSSLAGKWTLIDFCSVWCSPCKVMATTTQQTWLNWYLNTDVPFEYVTALIEGDTHGSTSTVDDALQWSWSNGITRPVLHSSDLPGLGVRKAAEDAETYWTPTLRLINPAGQVVWLNFGSVEDTTIARVVANAVGVAIPTAYSPAPEIYSGLETVTYGGQQASQDANLASGWTFFYVEPGFGYNFTSSLLMKRHPNQTEDWTLNLVYWPNDAQDRVFPTANDWQITLSNMQLDAMPRFLPPGATATVVATDSFGVDHPLPDPIAVTWAAGTLTCGAIPAAQLAALPPIRTLTLSLTMQNTVVAGIDDPIVATTLALRAPSPNPARSSSRLTWSQPRGGFARLDVFDINGRHVRTLAEGLIPAGVHSETWDLADKTGVRVGAGLYFARVSTAGEQPRTQRITVLR